MGFLMYFFFLSFSSQTISVISTWSGFVIYLFRVISTVLGPLYRNCPVTFKLRSYFVLIQRLSSKVFCIRGSSWRFSSYVGGRLCCSLFLIKLQASELPVSLKGDYSAGVFSIRFAKFFKAPILKSLCQQQLLFLLILTYH